MGKNNNIIEINGKRYNAATGALLSPAPGQKTVALYTAKPAQHKPHGTTGPVQKSKSMPPLTKPTMHDIVRRPAASHAHHKPSDSQTLMRRGVQKPNPALKRRVKAQGATDTMADRSLPSITAKHSVQSVNEKRLQRAKRITQSQSVRHFSESVWTAPTNPANSLQAAVRQRTAGPYRGIPQQPMGGVVPAPARSSGMPKKPSSTINTRSRAEATSELLERALEQANSHQVPPPKVKRRGPGKRSMGFGAAIVLAVAVTGVIVSQNLSSIRLQMVSAKAGFSAALPSHQPAGYSMGPLAYSNGVVSAKFQSNSGNRHYTIIQKRSSWDSQTLRDSFVVYADTHYQTIQAGGQTVYLYGKDDATWVSNGIWYIVQGNGSLSSHQLVELATSM